MPLPLYEGGATPGVTYTWNRANPQLLDAIRADGITFETADHPFSLLDTTDHRLVLRSAQTGEVFETSSLVGRMILAIEMGVENEQTAHEIRQKIAAIDATAVRDGKYFNTIVKRARDAIVGRGPDIITALGSSGVAASYYYEGQDSAKSADETEQPESILPTRFRFDKRSGRLEVSQNDKNHYLKIKGTIQRALLEHMVMHANEPLSRAALQEVISRAGSQGNTGAYLHASRLRNYLGKQLGLASPQLLLSMERHGFGGTGSYTLNLRRAEIVEVDGTTHSKTFDIVPKGPKLPKPRRTRRTHKPSGPPAKLPAASRPLEAKQPIKASSTLESLRPFKDADKLIWLYNGSITKIEACGAVFAVSEQDTIVNQQGEPVELQDQDKLALVLLSMGASLNNIYSHCAGKSSFKRLLKHLDTSPYPNAYTKAVLLTCRDLLEPVDVSEWTHNLAPEDISSYFKTGLSPYTLRAARKAAAKLTGQYTDEDMPSYASLNLQVSLAYALGKIDPHALLEGASVLGNT